MPVIKQLKRYEYTFSHQLSDVMVEIAEQFKDNPDKMPVEGCKNGDEIRISFPLPLTAEEEDKVKATVAKHFPQLKFKGVNVKLKNVEG
ncbi:MAG: hypothetical protein QXK47_02285 [Candidatus Bathyarchaeia archaeon]